MTVQDAIKDIVASGEMTAEDIASKAGLSMSTVTKVRAGRVEASRLTIAALRKIKAFRDRYDAAA